MTVQHKSMLCDPLDVVDIQIYFEALQCDVELPVCLSFIYLNSKVTCCGLDSLKVIISELMIIFFILQ